MVSLDDIINAVYDRLDADTTLFPYKKEDKKFPATGQAYTQGSPYNEVMIRPDQTAKNTVNGEALNGFLVFNTYFKVGDGVLDPASEGKKILALFPSGLVFDSVEIQPKGTTYGPRESQDREGWRYTPTIIPYEVLNCMYQ